MENDEPTPTPCAHCDPWIIRENELARNCSITTNDFEKLFRLIMNAYRKCPTHGSKDGRVGNGKPKGVFAGTLTKSTADEVSEDEMVKAIQKILTQQTCPVRKYAWYVEYTQNGTPHIHFIYETEGGGRIHQKVFKRYWKMWDESIKCGFGFRGGFHKPCASEIAYTEYIQKESTRFENKWDTLV